MSDLGGTFVTRRFLVGFVRKDFALSDLAEKREIMFQLKSDAQKILFFTFFHRSKRKRMVKRENGTLSKGVHFPTLNEIKIICTNRGGGRDSYEIDINDKQQENHN